MRVLKELIVQEHWKKEEEVKESQLIERKGLERRSLLIF